MIGRELKRDYARRMPFWVLIFGAGWLGALFTVCLAVYLDMRRFMLVKLGQLDRRTPEVFHTPTSTMGKVMRGWIAINLPYVFSRRMSASPDATIRRWAPVLRVGLIGSPLLVTLSILIAAVTTKS